MQNDSGRNNLTNTTRAITLNGTHTATNATTTVPVITIAPPVSNDTAKKCFSGDSQIKIADGTYKSIAQLQFSDRLAGTTDSDFVLMLDSDPNKKTSFYTITTKSSKQISLSGNHLIPIRSTYKYGSEMIYKFAKEVKVDDSLFNDELGEEKVISIGQEVKVGYYAPLSGSGE
ncbi:unnamed protein product [Didymodactylos carnosus]|uniref:Hint domain-containing protein n=1 Tax=Didymodactylos carnosus TaxID=1234261 RepID=A0A814RUT2_9BILA|nr:unnamed protein product [Didymodactylos carnosus]CAF1138797.1 unnamed protein product [Didymodactylos carnosus]CAF3639529.1 unnamed protein product [Didymodactylos carnosus]CAF3902530.1 unnamed protein product [Didymodactylos carnosus]